MENKKLLTEESGFSKKLFLSIRMRVQCINLVTMRPPSLFRHTFLVMDQSDAWRWFLGEHPSANIWLQNGRCRSLTCTPCSALYWWCSQTPSRALIRTDISGTQAEKVCAMMSLARANTEAVEGIIKSTQNFSRRWINSVKSNTFDLRKWWSSIACKRNPFPIYVCKVSQSDRKAAQTRWS